MFSKKVDNTKDFLKDNWKTTLGCIALGYIIINRIKSIYNDYKLPPGPHGYPFFGSVFQVLFDPNFGYMLGDKYGDISYHRIFKRRIIMVNDVTLMKRIWKRLGNRILFRSQKNKRIEKGFRTSAFLTHYKNETAVSLVAVDGDKWKRRRKHAQTSLFRLLTNNKVNEIMKHSLSVVDNELNKIINGNGQWFPRKICMFTAFNTIFVSCFGKSVDMNDQDYIQLSKCVDLAFRTIPHSILASRIPFLIAFKYFRKNTIEHIKLREDIIERLVIERQKIYNKNKPETYVDYSLNLLNKNEIRMIEILADVFFLFAAGQDTTSSTAESGIILLAKQTDIQQKMRELLLKHHKKGELFNLNHVRKMPEYRALIYEIIRISSVVPFGVAHQLREDEYITLDNGKEYKLPKDSPILYNVQYIHQKSKNTSWIKNGTEICLDNWLFKDNNGNNEFKINDSFISFGIGRRDCVGKMLAVKELYVIIGHLLLNYKWEFTNPNQKIRYGAGITIMVDPPIPVKIQKIT